MESRGASKADLQDHARHARREHGREDRKVLLRSDRGAIRIKEVEEACSTSQHNQCQDTTPHTHHCKAVWCAVMSLLASEFVALTRQHHHARVVPFLWNLPDTQRT